jgi:hypothetical protein
LHNSKSSQACGCRRLEYFTPAPWPLTSLSASHHDAISSRRAPSSIGYDRAACYSWLASGWTRRSRSVSGLHAVIRVQTRSSVFSIAWQTSRATRFGQTTAMQFWSTEYTPASGGKQERRVRPLLVLPWLHSPAASLVARGDVRDSSTQEPTCRIGKASKPSVAKESI